MSHFNHQRVNAKLARRRAKERYLRRAGLASLFFTVMVLILLFTDIAARGVGAFWQSHIRLDLVLDSKTLGVFNANDKQQVAAGAYAAIIRQALRERFPEIHSRKERRELYALLSLGAGYDIQQRLLRKPQLLNTRQSFWLLADDDVDMFLAGKVGESPRGRLSAFQVEALNALVISKQVKQKFSWRFFASGDSAEPEQAGIKTAVIGSVFALTLVFIFAIPIAVATAIYLEEYALPNRMNELIEININNLAAMPSVVFGLLGLAIFINFLGMPRATPLAAAMVLTLMTLPNMIIASRKALQAVPNSVRDAALAVGASKMQIVAHHVLPPAMPRILAGAINCIARDLGEAAPLLIIGMGAFFLDTPQSVTDPATVLPVQIYLWALNPEPAFAERSAAAVLVLMSLLMGLNMLAAYLRNRFERQ